jgi:hypothetical protein
MGKNNLTVIRPSDMDLSPPPPDWVPPRNKAGSIRLGAEHWAKIQARYERGDKLQDIATDYQIVKSTISNRAKRENWRPHGSLAREASEKARNEVADELKDTYKETTQKAMARHAKIWESLQRIGGAFIEDLAEIARRRRMAGKREFGKEVNHLKTLAETMRIAVDGDRTAFNMDAIPLEKGTDSWSNLCDKLDHALYAYEKAQEEVPASEVDIDYADEQEAKNG